MAHTQDELDALKAAFARGVTRVRFNGEEVQYDSATALLKRIRIIEADLAGHGAGGISVSYPRTLRGL
ncbi:hypothetical protein BV509_17445 [Rhodovulum sulfidophilum]|nr:hypothetical protein BV509_17445 [Rhodovulum sulfidophilum]